MSHSWTGYVKLEFGEDAVVPSWMEDQHTEDPLIGAPLLVHKPPDVAFVEPNDASHLSISDAQSSIVGGFGTENCGSDAFWGRQLSGEEWFGESTDLSELLWNMPELEEMPVESEPISPEEADLTAILEEIRNEAQEMEMSPEEPRDEDSSSSAWSDSHSEASPGPAVLQVLGRGKVKSRSRGELKERKRLQNREAATRYRMKKKTEKDAAGHQLGELMEKNKELKGKIEDTSYQIKILKDLMLQMQKSRATARKIVS